VDAAQPTMSEASDATTANADSKRELLIGAGLSKFFATSISSRKCREIAAVRLWQETLHATASRQSTGSTSPIGR
jgi:hypothetical protein